MAWRSSVSSRGGCNLICTTDSGPDVCSSVKLIRCDEFLSWLWSKIDKGYDVIAMGTYSLLESNLVILFWHSCISHWPQKSQVFIFLSWTCAVSFYFLIHELNKTLAPVFNIYCAKLLLRVFFFFENYIFTLLSDHTAYTEPWYSTVYKSPIPFRMAHSYGIVCLLKALDSLCKHSKYDTIFCISVLVLPSF